MTTQQIIDAARLELANSLTNLNNLILNPNA